MPSGVVCSIHEPAAEAVRRRLDVVPGGCRWVEIRADSLSADDLPGLIRAAPLPVIVTARRARDGGSFEGSEEARRKLLVRALAEGADYVDVEHRSPLADLAAEGHGDRLILSSHDVPCRAEDLAALYREMRGSGAALLKIVPTARTAGEILAVRDLLVDAGGKTPPLGCFAAGRAGALSRLLALSWGSWCTYGAAARGRETAAGQFTAEDLLGLYDVRSMTPETRLFALIGDRVFSSPSPAMHIAAYRRLDLDARYVPVELDDIAELLPLVDSENGVGISGLGVTMPFKESAARRCELRDDVARLAGAVNTVLLESGAWGGFNTDGPAAVSLVRRRIETRGLRVAVAGAGGTGRGIASAFHQAGAEVELFNRDPERGARAGGEIGVPSRPLEALETADWEVLVHCTPPGGAAGALLRPGGAGARLVLDVVYHARPTPLAQRAAKRGLEFLDGFELLIEQAVGQFELLTGRRPSRETMSRAGRDWLQRARSCDERGS